MEMQTEALLTPVEFYTLLNTQFTTYRNQNKPELLKNDFALPYALSTDNKDDLKETATRILTKAGMFLKDKAAATYEYILTHTALTQFVTNEMRDILGQQHASPLKKMIDLTILFQGLYNHLLQNQTDKSLLSLLEPVHKALWAATPVIENATPVIYSQTAEENQPTSIRQDALTFEQTFQLQIKRAQDLIAANTTESCQQESARLKQRSTDKYGSTGTIVNATSYAGLKSQTAPIFGYDAWHYRCKEPGEMISAQERIEAFYSFWRQEQTGIFGNAQERVLAYTQLGVELFQPVPSMGAVYDNFLSCLTENDHTLPEATLDVTGLSEHSAVTMKFDATW